MSVQIPAEHVKDTGHPGLNATDSGEADAVPGRVVLRFPEPILRGAAECLDQWGWAQSTVSFGPARGDLIVIRPAGPDGRDPDTWIAAIVL